MFFMYNEHNNPWISHNERGGPFETCKSENKKNL